MDVLPLLLESAVACGCTRRNWHRHCFVQPALLAGAGSGAFDGVEPAKGMLVPLQDRRRIEKWWFFLEGMRKMWRLNQVLGMGRTALRRICARVDQKLRHQPARTWLDVPGMARPAVIRNFGL